MTIQTLVQIILSILGVIILFGMIGTAFLYGKSTIKDNPHKAYVFVKTGRHISKPIKAEMIDKPTREGCIFKYSRDKIITVPTGYQDLYIANRRMIFVNHIGELIALPFKGDVKLSEDERSSLIYEICASHVGSDAMRFLKGKNTANIIIVAIIAFVIGAIAVYGFINFQEVMSERQAKIEQQKPSTQQELPKPVEVK